MILGWIMIGIFFAGMFAVFAKDMGVKTAALVFALAIGTTIFIVVAVGLISGALVL